MSNYLNRKTDFTPSVYTRYFQRTDTQKSFNDHIHFDDNDEQLSDNYQLKRDLLFKRLFPSKCADQNNNNNSTNSQQTRENGNNTIENNPSQSLGDYISLSNDKSSTRKSSSPRIDIVLSSSDENNDDDDFLIENPTPTIAHQSIIGHVHPRSVIENVRAILIRELYQPTCDSHTEWLKCKMNLPKDYINPKYYADFQRRYRHEFKKYSIKTTKSNEKSKRSSSTLENNNIIKSHSNNSSSQPEYIVLQSDDDDNPTDPTYFIDRSSRSLSIISNSHSTSNDDYSKEDSKYAQLPTHNHATTTVIRPIRSKHQRRKNTAPSSSTASTATTKPLVSAIDRIIDHMSENTALDSTQEFEQQNLLIKQIKKRKKKKQKKKNQQANSNSTN